MIDEDVMYITNGMGDQTPVSKDWGDGDEDVGEHFTLVRCRKKGPQKYKWLFLDPLLEAKILLGRNKLAALSIIPWPPAGWEKEKKYKW